MGNDNHNRADNNNDPFEDMFFSQPMRGMQGMGMPPIMNMNMMINNLMMGGMDNMAFAMQPRPRVANQENVDALPTDTYKEKINKNKKEKKKKKKKKKKK